MSSRQRHELDEGTRRLVNEAAAARTNAHAPYSGFAVGAAVRTVDGQVYCGCNIEISSYGLTMCAERVALFAARAAGIMPLGMIGTVADYQDLDAVRDTIRRSRRFGFEGASCIHPSVVPILNEEMAPSPDEVGQAERIVEAYRKAETEGQGAIAVDGKMVDVPVAVRARALLRRHAAIQKRDKAG